MELFKKEGMVKGTKGYGDSRWDEGRNVTRGSIDIVNLAETGSVEAQGPRMRKEVRK